jgi:hypothetical protein
MNLTKLSITLFLTLLINSNPLLAEDYHVGPSQPLETIGEVPWATLLPGDRIYIHWRDTPYFENG